MAMCWYRDKNRMISCLLIIPNAHRVGNGYCKSDIRSGDTLLRCSNTDPSLFALLQARLSESTVNLILHLQM